MFYNIPTPFEIWSNSLHNIAFIYKSRTGESIEMSSFSFIASVNGFDLKNKTLNS